MRQLIDPLIDMEEAKFFIDWWDWNNHMEDELVVFECLKCGREFIFELEKFIEYLENKPPSGEYMRRFIIETAKKSDWLYHCPFCGNYGVRVIQLSYHSKHTIFDYVT